MSDALNDVKDHLAGARASLTTPALFYKANVVTDHIRAAAKAALWVERDLKALTNERAMHLRLLEAKRQQVEHLRRLIPPEKLMKLQVQGTRQQ